MEQPHEQPAETPEDPSYIAVAMKNGALVFLPNAETASLVWPSEEGSKPRQNYNEHFLSLLKPSAAVLDLICQAAKAANAEGAEQTAAGRQEMEMTAETLAALNNLIRSLQNIQAGPRLYVPKGHIQVVRA